MTARSSSASTASHINIQLNTAGMPYDAGSVQLSVMLQRIVLIKTIQRYIVVHYVKEARSIQHGQESAL